MLRRTPLKRKSPLRVKTPMRRSRMKQKPYRQRTVAEGGDPARLQWIRSLDCCACGKRGPSHAHHRTLSGRGKGQKSSDAETIPMCHRCHAELHSLTGHFKGYTRRGLDHWQRSWVDALQGWYARLYGAASEVA